MIRRLMPTVVVTEGPSRGWGDLFDVQPLLAGVWHPVIAAACWKPVHDCLEDRRVVLVGRVLDVARAWGMLPPMRWLQLGRPGEPAEVMWLPGSVDPWRSSVENRALVDAWMAEERRRADKIARAWVNVIGADCVYWFVRGQFGAKLDGRPSIAPLLDRGREVLRRALTTNTQRMNRFGGGGWDNLRHSMLVRAALPADASLMCRRKALTHDHHETLVADLSSPLKGVISLDFGGGLWRECEQVADDAVEHLFGIDGLTDEDREAVKVADQAALRVEARALGADLGDPAGVHPDPGALENVRRDLAALPDDAVVTAWWVQWRADGGP